MIASNGVSVMNGYRDRSSYDPYAGPSYGRPLRPFNWVQWTGVAVAVAGIVFEIAYLASQAGWMRKFADTPTIGSSLVLLSIPLINSRREIIAPVAEEQRRRNRRVLLITLAFVVPVLVAAAAIDLLGAK